MLRCVFYKTRVEVKIAAHLPIVEHLRETRIGSSNGFWYEIEISLSHESPFRFRVAFPPSDCETVSIEIN